MRRHVISLLPALALAGCDLYDGECKEDGDCESGFSCVEGGCLKGGRARADGGTEGEGEGPAEGEGEGGGQPGDLVVPRIKVLLSGAETQDRTLAVRGDYSFCAVVRNAGPGDIPTPGGGYSYRWSLDGDDKDVRTVGVSATRDKTISAGEQWDQCTMMAFDGFALGEHAVAFTVNPDRALPESDASNNTGTLVYSLR